VDAGVFRPASLATPFANEMQFAGVGEKSLSKLLMNVRIR
jgi:hypothetical protein